MKPKMVPAGRRGRRLIASDCGPSQGSLFASDGSSAAWGDRGLGLPIPGASTTSATRSAEPLSPLANTLAELLSEECRGEENALTWDELCPRVRDRYKEHSEGTPPGKSRIREACEELRAVPLLIGSGPTGIYWIMRFSEAEKTWAHLAGKRNALQREMDALIGEAVRQFCQADIGHLKLWQNAFDLRDLKAKILDLTGTRFEGAIDGT